MSDALIDRKNVERLAQEFHDCDELPITLLSLCDRIEELEAKLELICEEWHGAVYGDLENGVASLNEAAAQDFHRRYPLVANFGATINRIIDGGKDEDE